MSDKVFAAVIAAIAAVVAALLTGLLSYLAARLKFVDDLRLQEARLHTELRTQFMAEEAIRELLLTAQPKRSFEKIKLRLGGFSDDDLRQLLVRAGAVCFKGTDGTEYWGLRERNKPALEADK
ncbi:hypothetical protein [Kitasatospora sp. NPDC001683]